MNSNSQVAVEQIVKTLLNVGERVIEVSKEQVMTRIWDREGTPLSKYRNFYEGKNISEIRNDSTVAQLTTVIKDAFITGKNCYAEYISYNNDVDAILTYSYRILTCHPNKDYLFIVFEDITRGNERILVEDRYKMALDASQQGLWDANMETGIIIFSKKWEELFGYSTKEIYKLSDWASLIHPDDIIVAEKRRDAYFQGLTSHYSAEIRYRCKDGSYRWILSSGLIVEYKPDGTPLRFIGTHADISSLKNVEEELRQSKEIFANSFQHSGTGKVLVSPEGKILEVNDVICNITGYSKEDFLKLDLKEITLHEDFKIDTELIRKLLQKNIQSYTIEKRYLAKDRRILTTDLTMSLVWNRNNTPRFFICDIIDRTRKKELSVDLRRRNVELEAASKNLLTKITQLEELNHIIAHNLRGPAGNIKMLSDKPAIFPDDESLTMINASSIKLLNSLDTLVEVSRFKLDTSVSFDRCNIYDIIGDITVQLQGLIIKNDIKINANLSVKKINYPKIYLESILYNLISNAIKYRSKDKQPVIEISTLAVGGKVQFSVKDNGIGIDLKKYGSSVFKLNQTFHKGYDSKGVGLFITKAQIESLGGTIEVQSKPNEGCNFIIAL